MGTDSVLERLRGSIRSVLEQESRTDLSMDERAVLLALKQDRVVAALEQHAECGESFLSAEVLAWDAVDRRVRLLFSFLHAPGTLSLRGRHILVRMDFEDGLSIDIDDPFEPAAPRLKDPLDSLDLLPNVAEIPSAAASYKNTWYPTCNDKNLSAIDLAAAFPDLMDRGLLSDLPTRFQGGVKATCNDDVTKDEKVD